MTASDTRTACLVLDGRSRPLRIGLLGRALAVEAEATAPALHPVGRIDRVAVLGEATIATAALHALAAAGCPLGLLGPDGRLAAALLPLGGRRASLAEALDRLGRQRHGADRLEDWRRARIAALARGLVAHPARVARDGDGGLLARQFLGALAPGPRRDHLAREMVAHATLAATAALAAAGVPASWRGGSGDPARNLVPAFATIALWHLFRRLRSPEARAALAAAHAADGRHGAPGAGPATLRLAALAEPALRRALGGELRQFHRWLLDVTLGVADAGSDRDGPWAG